MVKEAGCTDIPWIWNNETAAAQPNLLH
jgi:hypothetical protein